MTRKVFKKILMALLVMVLCMNAFATNVNAASTVTIKLNVTYGQTEARSMLSYINSMRTGSDAWYWNSDDSTKTVLTDLEEMTYDYALEQYAMQRAAECAIYFAHTRPDGTDCWTAYSEYNGIALGENIAYGQSTAYAAFTAWAEEDESYDGQGHRRNMLSSCTRIGIGHAVVDGYNVWVQVFGYGYSDDTTVATTANDGESVVSIDIDSSLITSSELKSDVTSVDVPVNGTADLPAVTAYVNESTMNVALDWTSSDTSVVTVENGVLVGKSTGTAKLTATFLNNTLTFDVSVYNEVTIDGCKYSMAPDGNGNTVVKLIEATNTSITSVSVDTITVNGTKYTVTAIKESAFANCTKLKKVTIGSGVTAIPDNAFYKCTKLTTVVGCKNVKTIGAGAFYNCKKLKSLPGCKKVTSVGESAFANCKKLATIKGLSKVVTIGDNAFENCTKLKTLGAKKGIITLSKVKTIGSGAFNNCTSIVKVNATSKALTTIKSAAFYNCTKLKTVIFKSKKLKSIGVMAFTADAKLSSVTLSTTKLKKSKVEDLAFWGISSTCTFKVPKSKVSAYKKIFTNAGADSTIKVVKK